MPAVEPVLSRGTFLLVALVLPASVKKEPTFLKCSSFVWAEERGGRILVRDEDDMYIANSRQME